MDEKTPLLRPLLRRNAGTGSVEVRREVFLAVVVFAAFCTFFINVHDAPRPDQEAWHVDLGTADDPATSFRWSSIPPSRTLRWHKCFDDGKYDCARLDVPLDWLAPTDEHRVVLAIARLPATDKHKDYRGPLFFNPGGPGGSGIWALKDHGAQLQAVAGRNHDIVTFDPRGIGASVPRLECWASGDDAAPQQHQRRHDWAMQALPVIDAHEGGFYDAWARSAAFSMACERAHAGTGLLENMGTASHARDLRAILDQMGEDQLLHYWGFSYGTVLGGTFAALYPDRVGRMVSDGNVDYEEWFNGARINSVRDADTVMAGFYTLCHEAGPDRCAFWGPSPADIQARHSTILARLRVDPVIYLPPTAAGGAALLPELVTFSKIRQLAATSLYRPLQFFPHLAEVLAGLEAGDGAPYYAFVTRGGVPFANVCGVADAPPPDPRQPLEEAGEGSADAFPAILCADGVPLGRDPRAFAGYAREMQALSAVAGAVVVGDRIACAARSVRPTWAFTGPFVGRTRFPILFVANVADNITPLVAARNNSAGFEGSVVLIQNSLGHTSLAAPSACTAKAIRAYFQDGVLPDDGTRCDPDLLPFDLRDSSASTASDDDDDGEFATASRELSAKANGGML